MGVDGKNMGRFIKNPLKMTFYVLPFVMVFTAIFAVINSQEKIWKNNLEKELQTHIYKETLEVKEYLNRALQDISFLADIVESSNLFNDSDGKAHTDIINLFSRFGYVRRVYSQLRVLDISGMELIRVDIKNGQVTICPAKELQDKSRRYYFTDSIILEKGRIYTSKLDLNIENEKIQIPYNPMIRFATPVFDKSGEKKGVIVLNYSAGLILDTTGKHSKDGFDSHIESQLLNKEGYWLYNKNPEKCWGFMFDDKNDCSMAVENPKLWAELNKSKSGILTNQLGIFVFDTVYFKEITAKRLGAETAEAFPDSQERFWKMVSYIPNSYIAPYQHKANITLFTAFGIISIIIVFIEKKLISAHKQLLQKQKNLETIFETVPVGMILLNETTEVVKANSSITKLMGEYHLGRQPGDLLRCIHSLEDPRGCGYSPSCPQCPIRNAIKTVLRKNESIRCAEVLSTLLIDGKKTDVWLEVNAEPVVLDDKRCVVVAINNITERKQAEENLRQTRNYLENLLNYANAPIICWDTEFKITRFNHAFEHLTNYKQEEVIGKNLNILFPENSREESFANIRRTLTGERWEVVEIPILRKDGSIRMVLWNSANIYADDGKTIIATIAQGQDITERKQAAEALRQSEEKSRLLLESAAEAIYGIDMKGNCTFCNNACLKTLGYKNTDELLGKNMHQQIHSKYADGTPFPVETCRIFQAFHQGIGTHVDNEVLWRADGTCFPAEYWSYPQRRDGVIIGAVVTFFDITVRKQAEDGLRKLSRAVEQNPVCIIITNTEGNIEYVNPMFTQLTGYSQEEVIGKNPRILKSGLTPPETYKQMWDAIKSARQWHGELCNRKKSGELYFEYMFISPVIDDTGKITHFVANSEDITLRKKAEREMKEAVEMKSRFISTASHELRTPLTSIKESVNLVHSETTGPLNNDQKEFLGIAKRNVDRLARLINDVLDYQKMAAGRMEFNLKPANINEVVRLVEETMRPLTKEKNLEFVIELNDAIPPVNFDKDKIIQVLTNLVGNAVKFTEKGYIKITTSLRDNSVITSVQDTGNGIRQEDMPRLFQEFQQLATKDAERKVGGTGLGLVISKKIIENHSGKIWAESEYEKGTTFYFELPLENVLCQIKS